MQHPIHAHLQAKQRRLMEVMLQMISAYVHGDHHLAHTTAAGLATEFSLLDFQAYTCMQAHAFAMLLKSHSQVLERPPAEVWQTMAMGINQAMYGSD